MKWRYFAWAGGIIALAMLRAGAPPVAVASGLVFATLLNYLQHRKGSVEIKDNREKNATNSAT